MSASGLSPSVGLYLPVTSKDLKDMKKQVLKQAYDQHLYGQRKTTINPELQSSKVGEKQPQTSIKSSKSISVLPSYQRSSNNITISKQTLRNNLQSLQSKQKIEAKNSSLVEHNDMLSFLENYQRRQTQKKQRQKQEYKAFLQSEIARKEQHSKNMRSEEKEMESVRANRRFGLMNKQRSFKEYFSNVSKYRDNCSLQYISYHQQIKKREKAKALQQKEAVLHQNQLMKEQIKAEGVLNAQKKQKLRYQLQNQISQSRNMRADELNSFKNRGYVKNEIDIYNPITNPIDYKLDLNNRYLLKQLFKGNQSKVSSYVVAEK